MSSSSSHYAVHKGHCTGVFSTWEEAKQQVVGFKGAIFKKFKTLNEAQSFAKHGKVVLEEQEEVIPHNQEELVVFTDGSSIGNGSEYSVAHYAVVWPFVPSFQERHAMPNGSTNNQAEYMACIRALEQALELDSGCHKPLHIYTDSKLLVNSMTKWIQKWKATGWKDGAVRNRDLLEKLDNLCHQRGKVHWNHVPAHTHAKDWKSYWNDKVDKLARDG